MFGFIRQFALISTLLGIGLVGLAPTTAEADGHFNKIVYQKGSVMTLLEPSCTNKDALIQLHTALRESLDTIRSVYSEKEDAGICATDVEVEIGDKFGSIVVSEELGGAFFTFEAIRTSDEVTVYGIASGIYQDAQ